MPNQSYLENVALRQERLYQLLNSANIEQVESVYNTAGSTFFLQLKEPHRAQQTANQIQELMCLTKKTATIIDIYDAFRLAIQEATCAFPENQNATACVALFDYFAETIQLDLAQGILLLDLKTPEIVEIFRAFTDTQIFLEIHNTTLTYDLGAYLHAQPTSELTCLVQKEVPLCLVLDMKAVAKDRIYFVVKEKNTNEVEVTPHYFISKKPPLYHFILDVSGSMKEIDAPHSDSRLSQLITSVINFANALCAYQPEATIHLATFNEHYREIGFFSKHGDEHTQNLEALKENMKLLTSSGKTDLYGTAQTTLRKILENQKQNNVLIFTDGQQNIPFDENSFKQEISMLQSPVVDRNKFFVIQFGIPLNPQDILHKLTHTFGSAIIHSSSVDLQASLESSERLQSWAAAQDIFSSKAIITNIANGQETVTVQETREDESGQLKAGASFLVNKGSEVRVIITNSQNELIADSHTIIPVSSLKTEDTVDGNHTHLSHYFWQEEQKVDTTSSYFGSNCTIS